MATQGREDRARNIHRSGCQRLRLEKWKYTMEIVTSGDPSELPMNWRLIIKGINKEIFYLKVLVALYSNFNSESCF